MVSRGPLVARILTGLVVVCVPAIVSVAPLGTSAHAESSVRMANLMLESFAATLAVQLPQVGERFVGSTKCRECHHHEAAGNALANSRHFKSFTKRYKSQEAKEILKKLRDAQVAQVSRSMKRSARCIRCHFSGRLAAGKFKTKEGVSCESCHGPARDWINVHNDYGARTAAEETQEHKQERINQMENAGMIRPHAVYRLAENCYSCHIVADEALVNVSGHTSGSDFELVAWSQGEVRHNFATTEEGRVNEEATPKKKRVMYVIGWAVDLALSLKALATADSRDGKYAQDMKARIVKAQTRLEQIIAAAPAEIEAMLNAVPNASGTLDDLRPDELNKSSAEIAQMAREFASKHDGSELRKIDARIPGSFKGKIYQPSD